MIGSIAIVTALLSVAISVNAFDLELTKDLPSAVDYRTLTSPIKEQGDCGACWAFSPLETVETMMAIRSESKTPNTFSVQHIIDCSGITNGCHGGDICDSVNYLQATGYIFVPEESYAEYAAEDLGCRQQVKRTANVSITGYWCDDFSGREERLLEIIAEKGPVIASVDSTVWKDYLGGIIRYNCDAGEKNHAVVIVGYDLTSDPPFYIVRNSWGTSYGDQGYMYVRIGDNLCGIADRITWLRID